MFVNGLTCRSPVVSLYSLQTFMELWQLYPIKHFVLSASCDGLFSAGFQATYSQVAGRINAMRCQCLSKKHQQLHTRNTVFRGCKYTQLDKLKRPSKGPWQHEDRKQKNMSIGNICILYKIKYQEVHKQKSVDFFPHIQRDDYFDIFHGRSVTPHSASCYITHSTNKSIAFPLLQWNELHQMTLYFKTSLADQAGAFVSHIFVLLDMLIH